MFASGARGVPSRYGRSCKMQRIPVRFPQLARLIGDKTSLSTVVWA